MQQTNKRGTDILQLSKTKKPRGRWTPVVVIAKSRGLTTYRRCTALNGNAGD